MKSKKNNYKLKITDLDLYQAIKNNLKKTIKDKRDLNKECISYIRRLKIFQKAVSILRYSIFAHQIKKPINYKEGGIVISENNKAIITIDGKPISEIAIEKRNDKLPDSWKKISKKLGTAAGKIRIIKENGKVIQ